MQNITPAPHQDQTRARRGVDTAAESYPILSQHWPGFAEMLAAVRHRKDMDKLDAFTAGISDQKIKEGADG